MLRTLYSAVIGNVDLNLSALVYDSTILPLNPQENM